MLPSEFFEIVMFSASQPDAVSLELASVEAEDCFGIEITKQGLDEKYAKPESIEFMRSIFDSVLEDQICIDLKTEFSKKITAIRVKDSTRFDLPAKLKDNFAGNKGKNHSAAAMSIQCEMDICNGTIINNHLGSIKRTDYQDAVESLGNIKKGDLLMRDLGYFKIAVLEACIEAEAYYVNRLHSKIKVLTMENIQVSFEKLYKKMLAKKQTRIEMQVKIGDKEKLSTRLIIEIIPQAVYEKRITKNKKTAKNKGHNVSDEFKARARFNLMITNVAAEELPMENVYRLYKLRWQIELVFKNWKSLYNIDKVQSMKYNRFMCLMYAKLILIVINNQLINLLQPLFYKKFDKLLSKMKCIKTLNTYFAKTRTILFERSKNINEYLADITKKLSKKHWLEKRKNRTNYIELFELFICKSA